MYTRQISLEKSVNYFLNIARKSSHNGIWKRNSQGLWFPLLFFSKFYSKGWKHFFINKCFQCREISIKGDDPCSLSETHEFWVYETQHGYYNRTNTKIWSTVPDRIGWFVFVQILVMLSILFITTLRKIFPEYILASHSYLSYIWQKYKILLVSWKFRRV